MATGIIKQPDLDGVSDEVRKYIDSLNEGYDDMLSQLEKATKVIEELTDDEESASDDEPDGGDDEPDAPEPDKPDPKAKKEEETPPKKRDKVGKSEDEDDVTDLLKAHPEIAAAIAKASDIAKAATERAERAEKLAKAERDRRLSQEFLAKARTLDALAIEHEPVAKTLQSMADKLTPEENEVVWRALHAANEQARSGDLFNELGSSARGIGKTGVAETDLAKAAKVLMDKDPKLDYADAVTKAVGADPTLYHQYIEEQRQVRR